MDRTRIQETVVGIVADALDRKAGEVRPDSSLVDDLGAESIDFLDIVFRLEGAFDLKIPEEEIWRGSADLASAGPEEMAAGLARLRERMPGFRWDRFPANPGKRDLARLITVTTIVDYLERRLGGTPAEPPAPESGAS